jgi:hypothetical protein
MECFKYDNYYLSHNYTSNIDRHPFSIPLLYTPYVGGYFGNVQQMICSYFGPTLPHVAFMCGSLMDVCHLCVSMYKHSKKMQGYLMR